MRSSFLCCYARTCVLAFNIGRSVCKLPRFSRLVCLLYPALSTKLFVQLSCMRYQALSAFSRSLPSVSSLAANGAAATV